MWNRKAVAREFGVPVSKIGRAERYRRRSSQARRRKVHMRAWRDVARLRLGSGRVVAWPDGADFVPTRGERVNGIGSVPLPALCAQPIRWR